MACFRSGFDGSWAIGMPRKQKKSIFLLFEQGTVAKLSRKLLFFGYFNLLITFLIPFHYST